MNGFAKLRSEFIMHNQRHTLAFESWVGDDFRSSTLHFAPRWSMCGLIQAIGSISTLSMSDNNHYEWLENVEIGELALK